MTNDFWVPVTTDDETGEKLDQAVLACYRVHCYTLETLNSYFIDHAEPYLYGNFREELKIFLRKNRENLPAQYYSLIRAAEKTFPYFTETKKFNRGKFVPVPALPLLYFHEIQIETRQIWRKYMALNNLITTSYGTIYLDESWPQIIQAQAEANQTTIAAVPFLWHSVTYQNSEKKLRFNIHEPDSRFGKRARKEMKKYV